MIKVGFDLFDTLLNATETHKKLREKNVDFLIAKKYYNDISKKSFYKHLKKSLENWSEKKLTEHQTGGLIKTVLKKCQIPVSHTNAKKIHEDYLEELFEEAKINPILNMIINICHKNGIDMFILSNATSKEIQLFEKHFSKINKNIKQKFYSGKERIEKRDDTFYKSFFEKFGIKPENFIYFGNDDDYDGKITKFGAQYISTKELSL
jgi:FMN phosphatase YigB (HAD superfamily)